MSAGRMRFRWIVEFAVDSSWVADGFEIDDERAHEMLASVVQYAHNSELEARVISSPAPDQIRRVQGYGADRRGRAAWSVEATVLDDRDALEAPDVIREFNAASIFEAILEALRIVGESMSATGDNVIKIEIAGPPLARAAHRHRMVFYPRANVVLRVRRDDATGKVEIVTGSTHHIPGDVFRA